MFYHKINYSLWVIDKIINEVEEKLKMTNANNGENGDKKHRLVLPYKVDGRNFKINGKVCYKTTPKEANITSNVHWKETKILI